MDQNACTCLCLTGDVTSMMCARAAWLFGLIRNLDVLGCSSRAGLSTRQCAQGKWFHC